MLKMKFKYRKTSKSQRSSRDAQIQVLPAVSILVSKLISKKPNLRHHISFLLSLLFRPAEHRQADNNFATRPQFLEVNSLDSFSPKDQGGEFESDRQSIVPSSSTVDAAVTSSEPSVPAPSPLGKFVAKPAVRTDMDGCFCPNKVGFNFFTYIYFCTCFQQQNVLVLAVPLLISGQSCLVSELCPPQLQPPHRTT